MSCSIKAVVVLSALSLAACIADVGPEDEEWGHDRNCVACQDDGRGMQMADQSLVAELKAKYGVRPRTYGGFFNGSNQTERRFLKALPQVARFLNDQLRVIGSDLTVSEADLAMNFITEGGYYVLNDNYADNIDGFSALGIDTLVDNYAALKRFLHPSVQKLVEAGKSTTTCTNEKGEIVHSLGNLTLEEGLYANGGMFVWSRVIVDKDMGGKLSNLSRLSQYFWTTVYYNAGSGTGHNLLVKKGAAYAGTARWTKADDAGLYGRNVTFNALWRTSSLEYIQRAVYDVKHPDAPADEVCTDNADNDGDGLTDCDDEECQGTSACSAPKPTGPVCGDGWCDAGETAANCPGDCSGSCQGFCGKQAAGGCWCDEFCAKDPAGCCQDYAQFCK